MSYQSYQVATDGDPTSTSNLIPEGPPKVTYNDQPGALSVNADGSTSFNTPRSYNTANAAPSGPATGILATAKTAMGSPCLGPITAKDIVTVQGMEVSVATAEAMGMVHKDVMGRYVETTGGVEQAKAGADAENQRQEREEQLEGLADPKVEADLGDLCSAVSPSLQVAAVEEIISAGAVDTTTLNRAASEAGIEPGEMQQRLDGVLKGFEAQALKAVVGYGSDDPQGFIEWAQQHRPNDLRAAGRTQVMERSTKGYEPMVREYIASMAEHDPESVMKAQSSTGVTVTKVKGQVLVNIPGKMPMTYRTALREGLIRVSGA
ncbi:hypothetical protein ACFQE0_00650 [Methylobacterium komagatae]|uniref:Uncharacterized protein n=1 Tax=Methylobacterium komagatae TaxID=374425 RepID=A0ABW2BEC2_9HYPH